nr:MAG TPA: hypothetical protein [Caudoviricetes sp.]
MFCQEARSLNPSIFKFFLLFTRVHIATDR